VDSKDGETIRLETDRGEDAVNLIGEPNLRSVLKSGAAHEILKPAIADFILGLTEAEYGEIKPESMKIS
jgi:hypothetical protein